MQLTRREVLNALIPSSLISLFTPQKAFSNIVLESSSTSDMGNKNIIPHGDTSDTFKMLNSLGGAAKIRTSKNETVEDSLQALDSKLINIQNCVFKDDFYAAEKFNIPGDFQNLQEAIDHLYNRSAGSNKYVTLNIQSGYRISSGVKVQHGDFSKFYIQSEDPIVYVADDFEGVWGPDGKNTITDGTIILVFHARGPVLGCIIDGRSIARTLYLALGGSHGWSDRLKSSTEEKPNMKKIAGGINFLHSTFLAQESSVIICENAIATHCHLNSIYCERNSMIHAEFSDVSNAGQGGVVVTRGGMVNADTVNADGCTVGFWAHRQGVISASDSHANSCKGNGYRADTGGRINAHHTSASNTSPSVLSHWDFGGAGYFAFRGGEIVCSGKSNATNCVYGLLAIHGAKIMAFQIKVNNSLNTAVSAIDGSQIEAGEALINNSKMNAVNAVDGSSISIRAARINNSGGDALVAMFGSSIAARDIKINFSGGVCVSSQSGSRVDINNSEVKNGKIFDLQVLKGAVISANSSSFGKANHEFNKNTSDGIIYF